MSYSTSATEFCHPPGWQRRNKRSNKMPIDGQGLIDRGSSGEVAVICIFVVPMVALSEDEHSITLTEEESFDGNHKNRYVLQRASLADDVVESKIVNSSGLTAFVRCEVRVYLDEWGPLSPRNKVVQRWSISTLSHPDVQQKILDKVGIIQSSSTAY